MKILRGKHCGFCFGVQRAVDCALSLKSGNNYVLGEIIHNQTVNEKISRLGIKKIDSLNDATLEKNSNIIIRTHGEVPTVIEKCKTDKLNIIDCTCPFVKKIHNIVKEKYKQGYQIVIIGKKTHPEVIGINGWCDNTAIITEGYIDLSDILSDKICVVVQTTYSEKKFEEIIKNFACNKGKIVDIFKTICYTTIKRQKEAEIIAKQSEAVVVLGGANSSNTSKLEDICSKYCSNIFRATEPSQLDYAKIKNFNVVGIVLGASTPIEQFQEVVSSMEKVTEEIITTEVIESDNKKEEVKEVAEKIEAKAAKSEMEAAFESIKPSKDFKIGQVVTAKISSANDLGLTLSMKYAKKDFELPASELLNEYKKEDYSDKIGSEIRVMVVAKNPIKFSEKAMVKILKEEAEIEEIKNGKIFEAQILSTNKGGLTGKFGSYEVFVPASQIKLGFVKDLEKYVGKTLRLKAEKVESRGSRRQIVGSQKVILEEEKALRDAARAEKEAEFFGAIQEGDVVLGTPVRFTNFGAFIDVNGFDCLAHISDLSWTGCKDCASVLEIGTEYKFVILKIDIDSKKVSLGYKQLQPKPWDLVPEKFAIGDTVKGKVVRLVDFGAFVELEKGVDGLIHVSEIAYERVDKPASFLEVGQEVEAKILDINLEKEKINLSIKALLTPPEKPEVQEDKKSKKNFAKEEDAEVELREWKDQDNGDVSIAEMIGDIK